MANARVAGKAMYRYGLECVWTAEINSIFIHGAGISKGAPNVKQSTAESIKRSLIGIKEMREFIGRKEDLCGLWCGIRLGESFSQSIALSRVPKDLS